MRNVHTLDLGGGVAAVVDMADAEVVAGFNWRLVGRGPSQGDHGGRGYVQAQRGGLYLYLHRLIVGAGPRQWVDHRNQDTLDNRTCNLRVATPQQNAANRGPDRRRGGSSSRHKGVSWSTSKGRWLANIHIDGRTRYLGRYTDEDEAADAYNRAALDAWGEFARLNDVPDREAPSLRG